MNENRANRTIFTSGLPTSLELDQLKQYFGNYGEITDARIVKDPKHTTCYAFVEFSNFATCQKVISMEHTIDNQPISVIQSRSEIIRNNTKRTNNNRNRGFGRNQNRNQFRDQMNSGRARPPMRYPNRRGRKEERTVSISGISKMTTKETLIDFAREFGDITNYKFVGFENRFTERFAFFEFYDMDAFKSCLERTGVIMDGSIWKIELSRTVISTRPPKSEMSMDQKKLVERTVHVSGVHVNASKEDIRSFFTKCGEVEAVRIAGDATGRFDTRYAFVQFRNHLSAKKALQLSGSCIGTFDKEIRVTFAREPIGHRVFLKKKDNTNNLQINPHANAYLQQLNQTMNMNMVQTGMMNLNPMGVSQPNNFNMLNINQQAQNFNMPNQFGQYIPPNPNINPQSMYQNTQYNINLGYNNPINPSRINMSDMGLGYNKANMSNMQPIQSFKPIYNISDTKRRKPVSFEKSNSLGILNTEELVINTNQINEIQNNPLKRKIIDNGAGSKRQKTE